VILFLDLAQVGVIPTSPLEMVIHGTGATKVVLAILAILSLISWAIMFRKWRQFRALSRSAEAFMHGFERAGSFSGAVDAVRDAGDIPQGRLLRRANDFLRDVTPALAATTGRVAKFSGSQVEALRLVLDAETSAAQERLSRYVPSLGTIGAVSPLIGLLGTVLGVVEAFIGIASQGSGNIGAVAPGVAEALIATAAALAVAIPAVFGYNIFANRLNRIDSELEGFGTELIALLVREGRI
jgi:biopolymer transport protein TolQ